MMISLYWRKKIGPAKKFFFYHAKEECNVLTVIVLNWA